MKSPSFFEFQTIIQYLDEELSGAQLQEVFSTEDGVVLGFYRFVRQPKTVWLVFVLDSLFPFVGLYDVNPWMKTKKTKPLALFLNSHFKNTHLKKISLKENYGRVAVFDFGLPEIKLELELRLIPKQPNLIALAQDKKISWDKEKELVAVIDDPSKMSDQESENRSVPYMLRQWFQRRSKTSAVSTLNSNSEATQTQKSPYEKWILQRKKDLQKKEKALDQIQKQNIELAQIPWSKIGDYLKTYGFKNLPLEWTQYVLFDQKVSDNIQRCFEKAKAAQNKIKGSEARVTQLMSEVESLKDVSEKTF